MKIFNIDARRSFGFFLIWCVVLFLTMGSYSHEEKRWAGQDFKVSVTQTEMGIPYWLVRNELHTQGNAPEFLTLPQAQDYMPGYYVNWSRLTISVLFAGLVTATVLWWCRSLLMRCGSSCRKRFLGSLAICFIVPLIIGIFIGLNIIQNTSGALAVLVVIPLAISISIGIFNFYHFAILAGFCSAIVMTFGVTFTDNISQNYYSDGYLFYFGLILFYGILFSMIAACVVFIFTALRKRRQDQGSYDQPGAVGNEGHHGAD